MSIQRFGIGLLTLIIACATIYAQEVTPPRISRGENAVIEPKAQPPANAITAIFVKSWGDNPVWSDLNTNWSSYGTIPVSIDHTTLIGQDFTYADLVNSKADVVILSDPAGGVQQYAPSEVEALGKYVKAGHPILGTYVMFQWGSVDNRALAPLFGLSSSLTYGNVNISNEFMKLYEPCLFHKIYGTSWQSRGYNSSQVSASGTWTGNLSVAGAVADSDNYAGIVAGVHSPSYTAIYISNMPEYQNVGGDDEQLLYNAITCYASPQ